MSVVFYSKEKGVEIRVNIKSNKTIFIRISWHLNQLSIMAEHFAKSEIIEGAWTQEPDKKDISYSWVTRMEDI